MRLVTNGNYNVITNDQVRGILGHELQSLNESYECIVRYSYFRYSQLTVLMYTFCLQWIHLRNCNVSMWQYDNVTMWQFGNVAMWHDDNVTIVVIWWCGIVAMWQCGNLAIWQYDNVITVVMMVLLQCGNVAIVVMWQCGDLA